ncbi:molybdenum cofactor guanylyltransferase [Jeotgalibacillus aurantiacus]|uniref:molybdenum cofactor guanylyltransferase n=1 Tax=Jeotgalibacillus aurantiacus TaxID=2763266 RepID=UPI001D0A89A7|nr:molybdenum cofactor guanylyltransferase [Jeotgalibacillus aurantiacus]
MIIIGAVMAGGKSVRFGKAKAFAEFDGAPFYKKAVDALTPHVEKVVLSIRHEQENAFSNSDLELIKDLDPYVNCGPLGGLYALMKQTDGDAYLVLPCDLPLFTEKASSKLFQQFEEGVMAVIPEVDGMLQPLSALYLIGCLPYIEKQLQQGDYRMMGFLNEIPWKAVTYQELDVPKDIFLNVNDQKTYEAFIQKYAHSGKEGESGAD